MPIFMDRHTFAKASANEIADAHRKDLDIQDRYGVKYLTYWFDEGRGTAFCLVDAPDAKMAERVHQEAHGEIATDIIEVDLTAVEAFLGRISDPGAAAGTTTKATDTGLRAIMFTDVVGSTEMTARLGDAAALELVRVHDSLVRRSLTHHGGREVKHTGDGIMASFAAVANAVQAAAEIQNSFAIYNMGASQNLSVRIGMHAGEPVAEHNDLFGATVQLAARLCDEAEADDIVVSGLVRDLSEAKPEAFTALGERRLKGFPDMVPVFRLEWRNVAG